MRKALALSALGVALTPILLLRSGAAAGDPPSPPGEPFQPPPECHTVEARGPAGVTGVTICPASRDDVARLGLVDPALEVLYSCNWGEGCWERAGMTNGPATISWYGYYLDDMREKLLGRVSTSCSTGFCIYQSWHVP